MGEATKVLFITQEIAPYLPESEIATICRQLPQAVQDEGKEIRTFMSKQPEAIDAILQKAAKENNKKIIGLETLDQQMDIILNQIPLKRQAEILMKDIKEKQKGIDLLISITDAYKAGDMAKAEALDKADDSMFVVFN